MKNPPDLSQNVPQISIAGSAPLQLRRDRLSSTCRSYRRFLAAVLVAVSVCVLVIWLDVFHHIECHLSGHGLIQSPGSCSPTPLDLGHEEEINPGNKIPLEVHIMSKCPDARDCLQQLVVPAMEQVNGKVDFGLSFIASVSNDSSEIICKHGPSECIGDILILCAMNLPYPHLSTPAHSHPRTPVIRSLGFANCLIASYERIPERSFVEECALEHGIDFDALNHCASRQEDDPGDTLDDPPLSGLALLRRSALHSEEESVSTSCTVRLDESVWCVRDGGVWRDCEKDGQGSQVSVLVDEIKRRWEGRNKQVR